LRIARERKLDVIPYVKMLSTIRSRRSAANAPLPCATTPHGSAQPLACLAEQPTGEDRWYLEALGIGADKQEDKFFEAWLAMVGNNWNTPAGRRHHLRSRSVKARRVAGENHRGQKHPGSRTRRYFRALDVIKGRGAGGFDPLLGLTTTPRWPRVATTFQPHEQRMRS